MLPVTFFCGGHLTKQAQFLRLYVIEMGKSAMGVKTVVHGTNTDTACRNGHLCKRRGAPLKGPTLLWEKR